MMTVTNLTPELFRDSRAELAGGPTWGAGTPPRGGGVGGGGGGGWGDVGVGVGGYPRERGVARAVEQALGSAVLRDALARWCGAVLDQPGRIAATAPRWFLPP